MSNFVALDVETANSSMASICQVGVVSFSDGNMVDQWSTLVNPEDFFDRLNTAIHGITENSIMKAPTFPNVEWRLRSILSDTIVVTHTPFDRTAIGRTAERYQLPAFACTWLDTAKVVRRAWPQFADKGYGLANVAQELGIKFGHHNAQEDARAAGEILLHAMAQSQLSLEQWIARCNQPISNTSSGTSYSSRVARKGNSEGFLYGEVVVFTGALSMPRKQAAEIAAEVGCSVRDLVNKETTLLVVGDQDIRRLVGFNKSSKHRKAEDLISKGQSIRILGETDFLTLTKVG